MQLPKALEALPRQVGSLLADVRKITDGMQTLPALLETLRRIEKRVESLDKEVAEMHAAVERFDGSVDDLSKSLHPLRRAFKRGGNADA